ncbi:hypothetical protein [Coleofasciculus chthonoplastes]|uniref:hypothetical protein n=1 Tax=Coleofasciculus chthonoplastes TaxID=64178 RepID=UPI0005C589FD|nr:hypothetical protein [Coleofasciculus chthonoplastes]
MSKLLQPFFQSTACKSGQTLKLGVGWAGAWGDEGDEGDGEAGEMREMREMGKLGQKKFDLEVIAAIAATLAGKGHSLLFPVPCSLISTVNFNESPPT